MGVTEMKSLIGGMLGGFLAVLFLAAVEAPGPLGSIDDPCGAHYKTHMRGDGANLRSICEGKTLDFSTASLVKFATVEIEYTAIVHKIKLDPSLTSAERSALTSPDDDISLYSVDDETALNIFDGDREYAWQTGGDGRIAQFTGGTESRLRMAE